MSWPMIEACMRKQGAIPAGVVPNDYQTSDTFYHEPHVERVESDCFLDCTPNLLLWTGIEHRLVLQLKDDA